MKKALLGIAAVAAVAALSACQSSHPKQVAEGETAQQDTCGLAAAQQFIGKNASVLETVDFAGPVRILRPNTAATMDFRANRLNFSVDDKGVITRAYCA
ncbi:I78 family peptidase inhibitor [Neisseriaceae bacterium CLB008]|nr:hypothetical protein [Neisseriaceae bacterium]